MATLSSFLVGVLFAIGLGISGMIHPDRVVGFLDVFGNWNPSLLFVMLGALIVHATLYRLIMRRPTPLLAAKFQIPTRTDIDRKLIVGAILFGSGWGLAGFCPAPAITSLASLNLAPFVFVASMLIGMWIFQITSQKRN